MEDLTERQQVVVKAMREKHGHVNVYRDEEGYLMVDTGPQIVHVDREGVTSAMDSALLWDSGWK